MAILLTMEYSTTYCGVTHYFTAWIYYRKSVEKIYKLLLVLTQAFWQLLVLIGFCKNGMEFAAFTAVA